MALINCPECGKQVSDKAKACIHCGYPFCDESIEEIKYCTSCGTKNTINSLHCCNCSKEFCDSNNEKTISAKEQKAKDIMTFAPQQTITQSNYSFNQQPKIIHVNNNDNTARCPKCNSTSLSANKKGFGVGKAVAGVVLAGGIGLLAGGIGANKTIVTCLNCGYNFKL